MLIYLSLGRNCFYLPCPETLFVFALVSFSLKILAMPKSEILRFMSPSSKIFVLAFKVLLLWRKKGVLLLAPSIYENPK